MRLFFGWLNGSTLLDSRVFGLSEALNMSQVSMFDFTLATYGSLFHLESLTASAITPALGLVLVYAAKPKSFSSFVSQCIDCTLHVCLLAALPMGLVWVSMGMFAILTSTENFATVPPEATGTMLITGVVAGILFCAAVLGRNQSRPIYVPILSN